MGFDGFGIDFDAADIDHGVAAAAELHAIIKNFNDIAGIAAFDDQDIVGDGQIVIEPGRGEAGQAIGDGENGSSFGGGVDVAYKGVGKAVVERGENGLVGGFATQGDGLEREIAVAQGHQEGAPKGGGSGDVGDVV